MRTTRKLAMGSLAAVMAVSGLVMTAGVPSAGAMSVADMKEPQKVMKLKTSSNAAVEVATELDCNTHTLTANVTNKTDQTVHPSVLFNNKTQDGVGLPEIAPGKTQSYFYNFSGNGMTVNVEVKSDTFETVKTSPKINCVEPLSLRVTDWSDSAVVGELTNNSTFVAQTAYTQVGNGDVRVETLEPGETRMVALPFKSYPEQSLAMVKIGTDAGYESTYMVDLDEIPPMPLPVPQIK